MEITADTTNEAIIAQFYETGDVELLGHIYTRFRHRMQKWSWWHLFMHRDDFREMYVDFWCLIQPRIERRMFDPTRGLAFSTWYYLAWKRFVWDVRRKKRLAMEYGEPEHWRSTMMTPEELLLRAERIALVHSIAHTAPKVPVDEILMEALQEEQTIQHMVAATGLQTINVKVRISRLRQRARNILATHPLRHLIAAPG